MKAQLNPQRTQKQRARNERRKVMMKVRKTDFS